MRIKTLYGCYFSRDVNQLFLLHLLKWTSSWLMTIKKERQHSILILMNVPSLMVKIEFFKSDVVILWDPILFVIQDDHILNLLEGVIKTKTYMKKGLNTMSDLKNISFIREGIFCSKITEPDIGTCPLCNNFRLKSFWNILKSSTKFKVLWLRIEMNCKQKIAILKKWDRFNHFNWSGSFHHEIRAQ